MALERLPHPIPPRRRLGVHRQPRSVAREIISQSTRRGVSLGRLFAHRLHKDGIQIAGQKGLVADGANRGWLDRFLTHPILDLTRPQALEIEHSSSGQQLEENEPEPVDIRRGRNGLSTQLFGRRVAQSHQAEAGACGGISCTACQTWGREQLGDSEIDQLDLAGSRHENVEGLMSLCTTSRWWA